MRQPGPGRQRVEEVFEFAVGERGSLARAGAGIISAPAAAQPGRIPLDEPEDVLLDRPPVARRAFPEPPTKIFRQVNDAGNRRTRPGFVSSSHGPSVP